MIAIGGSSLILNVVTTINCDAVIFVTSGIVFRIDKYAASTSLANVIFIAERLKPH